MPVKHIWCEVCESPKGPLFAVKNPDGKKHYICLNCARRLKEKEARDGKRAAEES